MFTSRSAFIDQTGERRRADFVVVVDVVDFNGRLGQCLLLQQFLDPLIRLDQHGRDLDHRPSVAGL